MAGRACAAQHARGETMSGTIPKTAMLLAAGLGTRMRPLTDNMPKPLIEVGGKALIDWTLDQIAEAGVETAVVNVHHKAQMLTDHSRGRDKPKIFISDETALLLDTGGGVVKALPLLGDAPFFVLNCDGILLGRPIESLMRIWKPDEIDIAMLVHPRETAHGFDGAGDFFVDETGHLERRGKANAAPFVYAGAYILHPRVLKNRTPEPFSMNEIWDKAITAGRMKAVVHAGEWFHVGTPDAVGKTDAALRAR